MVTKAFQYGSISLHTAWERAEKEYANLKLVRDKFGMGEGDFRTVAALGKNKALSALLVVEYGRGNTLDHYIHSAIRKNETEKLYYKLGLLAGFLVKLHRNSQSEGHPSAGTAHKYLKKVLSSLRTDLLDEKEADYIKDMGKHGGPGRRSLAIMR